MEKIVINTNRKEEYIVKPIAKSYSVWEYLFRIVLLTIIIATLILLLGNDYSPFTGFLSSSVVFFISTIAASAILLRTRKWILIFSIAYLVRLIIGFIFYLDFMDSNYFASSGTNMMMHFEYQSVYDYVFKIVNGYDLSLLYSTSTLTHKEIWTFIAFLLKKFGPFLLNISPINSFFSILISINLVLISKQVLRLRHNELKNVAVLTSYFPFTIISSNFYRDIIGIAIMSIALVLVMLPKSRLNAFIMIILGSMMFYLHRTPYIFILPLAFLLNELYIVRKNHSFKSYLLFIIFTIITIFVIFPLFSNYSENESNEVYISGIRSVNYLVYPIKFILGLIGPFPWSQWKLNPYQIPLYFQGAFNIAVLFSLIVNRKYFFIRNKFNLLTISGILLTLMGLSTTMMHVSYVSIGIIFMIPWIVCSIKFKYLMRYFVYSFISLFILNILVVVFIGNLGISSLWK